MSHDTLVLLAKSLAPIVLMGAFLVVIFMAYRPSKRAEYERVARSILPDQQGPDQRVPSQRVPGQQVPGQQAEDKK